MRAKIVFAGLAALAASIGMAQLTTARADAWEHEERMRRLHFDCEHGDRRACVGFGIMIGENRERHAEWRRAHPEWWWWEHR